MKLVLDIGNTHVHGGVFENGAREPMETFRLKTMADMTADSFGIKILAYLQCRGVDHTRIREMGICSVVPSLSAAASESALKFFNTKSRNPQMTKVRRIEGATKNPNILKFFFRGLHLSGSN